MLDIPKRNQSFWRDSYRSPRYPELKDDIEVEAIVVGAGITGLTTAYLLKRSGLTVAVLDKDTVGGGTTGRTTGKVTSQHGLIYTDLSVRLGDEVARSYAQANQSAIELIDSIIALEQINCQWQRESHYVYTSDSRRVGDFAEEVKTALRLGLPASYEPAAPLPFATTAAVKFANQGRINAQQYTLGLAGAIDGKGSYVFEHSPVTRLVDGSPCRIKTPAGSVTAQHLVVATNVPTLPLAARGAYCLLEYPTESYIVAARGATMPQGMFISPDDDHYSILPVESDSGPVLLIGGGGNIAGLHMNKRKRYRQLTDYASRHFGATSITHAWSDRDYIAYDGVPLIGKLYPWSKHLYVASAFRKWGLTNGTVAAMILSDTIMGADNPYASMFKATRLSPMASIPRTALKYLLHKS